MPKSGVQWYKSCRQYSIFGCWEDRPRSHPWTHLPRAPMTWTDVCVRKRSKTRNSHPLRRSHTNVTVNMGLGVDGELFVSACLGGGRHWGKGGWERGWDAGGWEKGWDGWLTNLSCPTLPQFGRYGLVNNVTSGQGTKLWLLKLW